MDRSRHIFTARYATILVLLVATLVTCLAFVRAGSHVDGTDALLVNLSGRQRMLTQKATLLAHEVNDSVSFERRQQATFELNDTLDALANGHELLRHGDSALGIPPAPPEIHALLEGPPGKFGQALARYIEQLRPQPQSSTDREPIDATALAAEANEIVRHLDTVVAAYQHRAEQRLMRLGQTRRATLALIVTLLVGSTLAVFLPMVRQLNSERKLLEERIEALTRAEARFRRVIDSAPNGMILVDGRGRIELANAETARIFGYEQSELVGVTIEKLVPEATGLEHERLREAYMADPVAQRVGTGRELTGRRKDGSEVSVEIGLCPIPTDHGPVVLGSLVDTTERRHAEQKARVATQRLAEERAKLVQAEKLSSIGMLAAGVAHEVKNPLMGVMSCLKALRNETISTERRPTYYETAEDGLERIRIIVQGLLDYARQSPPAPAALQPAEVVDGCLRLIAPMARSKHAQITNRIATEGPTLWTDRTQLMQSMMNVLINAVHAIPDGGEIEITAVHENGRSGICIHDDGPGIPDEVIGKVCDPFFTTKPEGEGTGLGLAIALGLIESNGGSLHITSNPDAGTDVTLWFPTPA